MYGLCLRLVVLSQGEASEKVFYITYRGDEVDSFDLPRHSYAFTQYKVSFTKNASFIIITTIS